MLTWSASSLPRQLWEGTEEDAILSVVATSLNHFVVMPETRWLQQ